MAVNEKTRGRPQKARAQLSEARILAVAKALMKHDGKVPSLRELARQFDVDPMAIYHYFNNKNALLEALTVALVDEIYQPKLSEDWQQELRRLSLSYVTLLRDYNGLLQTMLSMSSNGPASVFTARYQTIIAPLGLPTAVARTGLHLLVDYLHGFALSVSCSHDSSLLTDDMLTGPLALICHGLLSYPTATHS
ncbi:TetR/AcrR family transcriptional regulator [Vibrio sp. SM6]|uniref:TetR/AcrR family transcriptional regulator n=1 Tax=Vibrio agarilyticus TaxID=2726741 RepID=A0A7X8YFX1_9VIBR|nr:TetR/AcrR family transcriptional regulator [Vibrio agarilyticus]NLS12353.1 TetR/AcrR family transcriptional regulator [Vibrio agarilyticus]